MTSKSKVARRIVEVELFGLGIRIHPAEGYNPAKTGKHQEMKVPQKITQTRTAIEVENTDGSKVSYVGVPMRVHEEPVPVFNAQLAEIDRRCPCCQGVMSYQRDATQAGTWVCAGCEQTFRYADGLNLPVVEKPKEPAQPEPAAEPESGETAESGNITEPESAGRVT